MRILHTADWHIGKRLHQQEMAEDFTRFTDWLVQTVQAESIDVLLVSGDIFDLANPSAAARQQYYNLLKQLMPLDCQVILTGGNHDSPAMLNAPRELLAALQIHIVGQLPSQWEDVLIPIGDNPSVVVAAIPYLRDADLVKYAADETYEERQAAVCAGIAQVFAAIADKAAALYPGVPLIGMGHLFTAGATLTDSERDIQVGNLGAFPVNLFPAAYDYIALGHIHRPQQPGEKVWYSGSPLALSFSEYRDNKRVVILDTTTHEKQSLAIPLFRQLIRIMGDLSTCREKLTDLAIAPTELPAWIELVVQEENTDPAIRLGVETIVEEFNAAGNNAVIIKHKLQFTATSTDTRYLFDAERDSIQALSPLKVFARRLEKEQLTDESQSMLAEAFEELWQEAQQSPI